MSDNEFDHIFSENLKNARSIIDPEEEDWYDLTSKLDQYQSKRRNWLKVLPWILLPFITGYAVWSGTALHHLKLEKSFVGNSQYNPSIVRDTIIVEKEKYIHDTLYKLAYVNRVLKEKLVSPVVNQPILAVPSEALTHQEEIISEVKKIDKKQESILQIVDTLSVSLVEKKEEVKIPDENKKESKTSIKVALSAGVFIPLSLDEIKNPVALQWSTEWVISPRFSLVPSLIFTQHFFETEDVSSSKVMLSSSSNPLGSFTLHEIKGIERNIIPSFSTNYYFLNKNKIRIYSGIGLGAKITMPAQITYEFIELSNNSSYKYSQVSNKISTEILMMGSIGGSLQVTSRLSFFTEAKMGISKGNTSKTNSFLATFLGVGYQF
ncbi:MAG: hypothetical protein NWR65_01440 [Saprospiraceae bacterium]|nr:hypothetical protein [Saprospiraceae bacterium]